MQAGWAAMARMHGFFLRLNPEIWTGGDRQCGSSDRWSRFCSAMADDFNFPKALSIVFEGIRAIHRSMNSRPGTSGRPCNTAERSAVSELYTMCHDILGFHLGHSFHAEAGSTAKMAMVSTLRSDSKSIHLN
jgi:cysteinyl-tRNA synthetase